MCEHKTFQEVKVIKTDRILAGNSKDNLKWTSALLVVALITREA